jgi:hypothetical protein
MVNQVIENFSVDTLAKQLAQYVAGCPAGPEPRNLGCPRQPAILAFQRRIDLIGGDLD